MLQTHRIRTKKLYPKTLGFGGGAPKRKAAKAASEPLCLLTSRTPVIPEKDSNSP